MFDFAQRLSGTLISRFRKPLIGFALLLVLLHGAAFVLGLMQSSDDVMWLTHLVDYSQSLLGFTGALLLLVLLSETVRALKRADEERKREVHGFIRDRLEEWFGEADYGVRGIDEVVDDVSYTDFKVHGDPSAFGDDPVAERFSEEVHYEFTFYPTKLIYGLHFESPVESLNLTMARLIQEELRLESASGFEIDHMIPKKPGWIFLIRTVQLSGKFEEDFPKVMTHARHFVELVGHTYGLVYSRSVLEEYRSLASQSESAGAGMGAA